MIFNNYLYLFFSMFVMATAQNQPRPTSYPMRGPLPFKWNTTYAARGIPFQACDSTSTPALLDIKEVYATGCTSSPCTIQKGKETNFTIVGTMRERVTKNLSFYAYAWETDIEYSGHSNDDFCDMLVPGGGNTKCPLPKGEVRLQFRLPAMRWEHKMDAQLEMRARTPEFEGVVCFGVHMYYRVPEVKSDKGDD